jgi:ubiquinone/menaquinone biosynthesis C-methylase UbiE
MGCHGGFNLDEATRRSWYNPDTVLQSLQAGMTFVDVGCGEGFFTFLAAKKVGPEGKVYAVDIDPHAIEKLQNKAQTEGLQNITAKAAVAEDTVFCKQCADIVFFSMDLHDFNDASKVLQNAREMIKPDGILMDLDWKKAPMPFGPPLAIRFSEQHVANLLRSAGFTVAQMLDVGPYHYVVTATARRL